MNKIEKIFSESQSAAEFSRAYLDYLAEILGRIDEQVIEQVVDVLQQARAQGSTIYLIGNGGSAATASHFANDLTIGTRARGKPFKAISLTDNMSAVSSIANDYGYEHSFSRQLEHRAVANDVVIAISASGNSPNIIKAIEYANEQGCVTVGFTGFDGGRLKALAQVSLHVPSDNGEYGPIEDVHLVFDHIISSYLMLKCRTAGASIGGNGSDLDKDPGQGLRHDR